MAQTLAQKLVARAAGRTMVTPGARCLVFAAQEYFATLKRDGTTAALRERMLDLEGINRIVGTPQMLELGKRYEK